MPENVPSDQAASGFWSYVAAGEWGEIVGRAGARLGLAPPPTAFVRPVVMRAPPPAPHIVALTHTLEREGAPLSFLAMLSGLARRGANVTLLAPGDGPLASAACAAGLAPVIAPAPQRGARGGRDYEARLAAFAARLSDLAPSLVVANTMASFHGLDAARLIGAPSVLIVREGEPPARFFRPYPRAVQARALGAMTYPRRIVFVSGATATAWPDAAAAKVVIRNAPDPEALAAFTGKWTRAAARESLGLGDAGFMILTLGSICRRKGQEDIARAAPLAPDACFFCVGAIAADGETIARDLRASANVAIAGATDDPARFYAAADAFALTSRAESYPRVIQEAQAFGLPIIATPVNGVPEQVGESEALFYQPGDAAALAAACRRLMTDPSLRTELAAASRARAASFDSYDAMITAYADALGV